MTRHDYLDDTLSADTRANLLAQRMKGLLDGKGTRPALGATSMAPSSSKDAT